MYVRRLEIENLRAFSKTAIDLLYPGRQRRDRFEDVSGWPIRLPNVNIFLGENGSGKSTILDGLALGLLSPVVASSGYRPYALIRRSNRGNVKRASIGIDLVLHEQDGLPSLIGRDRTHQLRSVVERRGDIEFVRNEDELGPVWEGMYDDNSPSFFVVGYGATRRVEALSANDLAIRRKSRLLRYERVASLFEDHFALTPLNAWLPEWQSKNPGRYKQVVNLINRLTPPSVRFTGLIEDGDYLFKHGTITVPFSAMSDGYRAYIGWVGDLLHHLCMGAPKGAKLIESRGIVLVDEIDLHIHPAWQRTIIPTLARTLKNLQFIFTTHSPLVVGTLERANIYTVRRHRGHPVVTRPSEEIFGLTADQILRSEAFGLDSTRDPDFRDRLRRVSEDVTLGKTGAAVQFMREAAIGKGATRAVDEEPVPDWLLKLSSDS